jgi:hypothetical protein
MGVPDISRGDPSDVFCLVKTYIHDTKLMQDPVLVLPAAFKSRVNGIYPSELFPRTQLVKKRRDNYENLATLLVRPESSYPKVDEMVNTHQHISFASHMFDFVCWPPVPSHQPVLFGPVVSHPGNIINRFPHVLVWGFLEKQIVGWDYGDIALSPYPSQRHTVCVFVCA